MEENAKRAEAERLLGIAEKLLQNRDFNGSRDFAILAQETLPLLEGSYQILAVADVLLASEKRINNHHDWYAVLQVDRRTDDQELIKKQYRRLAFLLHPDKNRFAFCDSAFRLVADAWAVLSDSSKKTHFDNELGLFSKVDLVASVRNQNQNQRSQNANQFRRASGSGGGRGDREDQNHQQQKLPVRRSSPWAEAGSSSRAATSGGDERRSSSSSGGGGGNFWTACPYCYNLFEYPKVFVDCCLRCQNCQRAFHAAVISSLPPLVPGKEAYYCCWAFFPMGFTAANVEEVGKKAGFSNPIPPPKIPTPPPAAPEAVVPPPPPPPPPVAAPKNVANAKPGAKKRGRPRKNPV